MDTETLKAFLWIGVGLSIVTSMLTRHITNPYVVAITHFPGVWLHELSHLVMAYLTMARPVLSGTTFIPRRNNYGGWTIASIQCANVRWYNALPVALAPILLLSAPYLTHTFGKEWLSQADWWELLLVLALNMIVTQSALPSGQDWRVAASKPFGLIMYAGIAAIAFGGIEVF